MLFAPLAARATPPEAADRPAAAVAAADRGAAAKGREPRESPAEELSERERKDVADNQADIDEANEGQESADSDLDNRGGVTAARPIELTADREGREFRSGEIVVLANEDEVSRAEAMGLSVIEKRRLVGLGGILLRLSAPTTPVALQALMMLNRELPSAASDLNHIYRPAGNPPPTPAHPSLGPGRGGLLGLVDTDFDAGRVGLKRAVVQSRSFAPQPTADAGHGAAVAFLAARGGARLLAAGVFTQVPGGESAASVDAMIRAMDWLVVRGAAVINLSIEGPPNRAFAEAVRRAQRRGCVIVAAAGNSGPAAPPAYPAAYPSVVAVTAVDDRGHPYLYANRGPYIMFAARGVDVPVQTAARPQGRVSGTSFAAPVVASLVALRMERPDPVVAANVVDRLIGEARHLGAPGRNEITGYGLLGD